MINRNELEEHLLERIKELEIELSNSVSKEELIKVLDDKYKEHIDLKKAAKVANKKDVAKFHEGCHQMAYQLFETYNH